ncbi:MAG: dTDP-4-dehydrorhamnose 3,5-epimerase [Bacteroidetes bacterium]|nr:dTDP-4-dehydrorhamnose 3,5-epimerase [Bacteroidota bacterium]
MIFNSTFLEGLYTIELSPIMDERGWFSRTYCKKEFENIGFREEWVQFNHSYTKQCGTFRGMHYQMPPHSEAKLIRCISGAVYDVAIDIRKGSPTFLQWFGTNLSAENKKMILIPKGFAHGFQALANDSELLYHHTDFYTPSSEGAIRYDDPMVNIKWPLEIRNVSEKDSNHPYLTNDFKGI